MKKSEQLKAKYNELLASVTDDTTFYIKSTDNSNFFVTSKRIKVIVNEVTNIFIDCIGKSISIMGFLDDTSNAIKVGEVTNDNTLNLFNELTDLIIK